MTEEEEEYEYATRFERWVIGTMDESDCDCPDTEDYGHRFWAHPLRSFIGQAAVVAGMFPEGFRTIVKDHFRAGQWAQGSLLAVWYTFIVLMGWVFLIPSVWLLFLFDMKGWLRAK